MSDLIVPKQYRLNASETEALNLKRLNYSHEEISGLLEKTLAATNKLIYRAHRKLKQQNTLKRILTTEIN